MGIEEGLMRLHDWLGEHVLATVELSEEPGVALLAAEGVLHHWTDDLVSDPSRPVASGGLDRTYLYALVPDRRTEPHPHAPIRLTVNGAGVRSAEAGDDEIRFVFTGGATITVYRR